MFIFSLLTTINCLIREIKPKSPIIELKQLPANTVVWIEIQYYTRNFGNAWQKLNPNELISTELVIENATERDWAKLIDEGNFNAEFPAKQAKTTFFFTSSTDNFYKFSFHLLETIQKNLGLEIKIYIGRANNPKAISLMDSTIRDFERQIKNATAACNEIDNVLKFDALDEKQYDEVIKKSARLIYFSIFLKITATALIMVYLNKKLKQFYLTNKIARK